MFSIELSFSVGRTIISTALGSLDEQRFVAYIVRGGEHYRGAKLREYTIKEYVDNTLLRNFTENWVDLYDEEIYFNNNAIYFNSLSLGSHELKIEIFDGDYTALKIITFTKVDHVYNPIANAPYLSGIDTDFGNLCAGFSTTIYFSSCITTNEYLDAALINSREASTGFYSKFFNFNALSYGVHTYRIEAINPYATTIRTYSFTKIDPPKIVGTNFKDLGVIYDPIDLSYIVTHGTESGQILVEEYVNERLMKSYYCVLGATNKFDFDFSKVRAGYDYDLEICAKNEKIYFGRTNSACYFEIPDNDLEVDIGEWEDNYGCVNNGEFEFFYKVRFDDSNSVVTVKEYIDSVLTNTYTAISNVLNKFKFDFASLSLGQHSFRIDASDNFTTDTSVYLFYKGEAPKISGSNISGATFLGDKSSPFTITYTIDDDGTEDYVMVEERIDDKTIKTFEALLGATYTFDYEFDSLEYGKHYFEVRADDNTYGPSITWRGYEFTKVAKSKRMAGVVIDKPTADQVTVQICGYVTDIFNSLIPGTLYYIDNNTLTTTANDKDFGIATDSNTLHIIPKIYEC